MNGHRKQLPVLDLEWRGKAACRQVDPEIMYPNASELEIGAAKAVCRTCPVAAACLRYALRTRQEHGVWGGTTEQERRYLLAGRKPESCSTCRVWFVPRNRTQRHCSACSVAANGVRQRSKPRRCAGHPPLVSAAQPTIPAANAA